MEDAKKIMRNMNYSPLQKVLNLLLSYPEKSLSGKYVHFLMDNKVGNSLNEGEDRNRNFIISFTPFYNFKFFKSIMSVPIKYKSNFELYRRFLKLLAPGAAGIYNANWGFNISEERKIRNAYLKEDLKRTKLGTLLKETIKYKKNHIKSLSASEAKLFEKYASNKMTCTIFDLKYARDLKNLDADSFYYLLTLMKVTALS